MKINYTYLFFKILKTYNIEFYNKVIRELMKVNKQIECGDKFINKKLMYIITNINGDPLFDLRCKYKNDSLPCYNLNDFENREYLGGHRWHYIIHISDLYHILISASEGSEYLEVNKMLWNNDILYDLAKKDYEKYLNSKK